MQGFLKLSLADSRGQKQTKTNRNGKKGHKRRETMCKSTMCKSSLRCVLTSHCCTGLVYR